MENTSCIKSVKSFTHLELYRFTIFLNSPYFNTDKSIIKLWGIIRTSYPDFNCDEIKKENVYKKLYGGKPYKEKTIRNLESRLYQLMQRFIGCNDCSSKKIFENESITDAINIKFILGRHYDSQSLIKREITILDKEIKKSKIKNSEYALKKYKLQKLINTFYLNHFDETHKVDLLKESSYFEEYSFLIKTDMALKLMIPESESIGVITEELQILKNNILKNQKYHMEYPVVKAFNIAYSYCLDNSRDNLNKIIEFYRDHKEILDSSQRYTIYKIILFNLFNLSKDSEKSGFMNIYNMVFNELIKEFDFYDLKYFNHHLLFYYINTSIFLKKLDEAEKFLLRYYSSLKYEEMLHYINFAYGKLLFEKREYKKARKYLSKPNDTISTYKLDAYHLSIICSIELNDMNNAKKVLFTLKEYIINKSRFLNENDIEKSFIENYFYFIDNVQNNNFKNLRRLSKNLSKSGHFPYSAILLQKIDKILNGTHNKFKPVPHS